MKTRSKKAVHANKTDMDKVGLFQEMSYVTVGDPYQRSKGKQERTSKKFILTPYKAKCANQSGYFAPKFLRLSEGDPYRTLADIYRKQDREASEKRLAGPLKLGGGEKMECGKGSFCATINPCPPAMSPLEIKEKKEDFKFVFHTSLPKKGTGYGFGPVVQRLYYPATGIADSTGHWIPPSRSGYSDVTINPYVSSKNPKELNLDDVKKEEMRTFKKKMLAGPFRISFPNGGLFEPSPYSDYPVNWKPPAESTAKMAVHPKRFLIRARSAHDHGHKLGTIHKFPPLRPEPYTDPQGMGYPKVKDVRNRSTNAYLPPSGPKSRPIFSTIQVNLDKHLNANNFRCMESGLGFCCS